MVSTVVSGHLTDECTCEPQHSVNNFLRDPRYSWIPESGESMDGIQTMNGCFATLVMPRNKDKTFNICIGNSPLSPLLEKRRKKTKNNNSHYCYYYYYYS